MSYLKEQFSMPSHVELSAPGPLRRADSLREGWVCFYKMAFKIGLRLPLHRIINIVLNFYSVALGQLMPNNWRYLLGLIFLSEERGLQIDIATFLYFFYMKPSEEGGYTLYARRQIRLFEDATTSYKGWKDRYFFIKREALEGATSEQQAEQSSEEEDPSTQQSEQIPEGIPLPMLEISKVELEAMKKKKKDKQAASKGGVSSQANKGEERPNNMVVIQPSSLPIAIPSSDSSPPPPKGKGAPAP
ncbi:hypothetical protein FNV43_RR04509 [Rhamnella rubrinervis]|uniref:Transposase (putative) gypsy type domain-containing protein n=1 Tax=Rhamnella rubrinervis TaxID=2594499 RepID=A0A8K0HJW0_9ROSA|nr:hypothetical protein FNV43_RR04509 [Rhamnella rubrinervis]